MSSSPLPDFFLLLKFRHRLSATRSVASHKVAFSFAPVKMINLIMILFNVIIRLVLSVCLSLQVITLNHFKATRSVASNKVAFSFAPAKIINSKMILLLLSIKCQVLSVISMSQSSSDHFKRFSLLTRSVASHKIAFSFAPVKGINSIIFRNWVKVIIWLM